MFIEIAAGCVRARAGGRARQMLRARLPVIIFQAGRFRPKTSSLRLTEAARGQIYRS